MSIAGDEHAILDRHAQIHVFALNHHLVAAGQPIHQHALPLALFLPRCHRVWLVQFASIEDEVLIIAQAHIRFLRQRVGGVIGGTPAQLAFGRAIEEGLHQRSPGLRAHGHALRIDAGERACVVIRANVQASIERLSNQL